MILAGARTEQVESGQLREYVRKVYEELGERSIEPGFSDLEYRRRGQRLRAEMEQASIDLMLVSSPDAMCWLHGYQSRWYRGHSPIDWLPLQCTAVRVDDDRLIHFDVAHHAELLRLGSVADEFKLTEDDSPEGYLGFLTRELKGMKWLRGRVALEFASHVPNRLASERLEDRLESEGCEVVDGSALQRRARRIKSDAEISRLEEAAAVCDAGLSAMQAALKPGMTELEAWAALVGGMAAAGGEPAALHESVVVGPIELGHAFASTRRLAPGDVVCADPCGVVDRYHANIERFFVLGEEPPGVLKRLAEIEAESFHILCETARPGVTVGEVARLIRAHLRDSGLLGLENWNGGYELGVSFPPDWVGEWNFDIDQVDSEVEFEAGMVTNFESIVLYPMIDTVVFGEDETRTLSRLPLDVMVAG